jgi:hypothetical protein
MFIIVVSVATATPSIVVVFVAPAIESSSSEESCPQNIRLTSLVCFPSQEDCKCNTTTCCSISKFPRFSSISQHPNIPDTTRSKASMSIIDHIIDICGFSEDSTIAEFIKQQGWLELLDVD